MISILAKILREAHGKIGLQNLENLWSYLKGENRTNHFLKSVLYRLHF